MSTIPGWKDKILFTPGPLTTSQTVKQALLRDLGSRDFAFIETVKDIRTRLVAIAEADPAAYTAIPLQGSGTYSVEAVFSACVPRDGAVLLVINGAYGERMAKICEVLGIKTYACTFAEDTLPDPAAVGRVLAEHDDIALVATVHCETTTGIVNPVEALGEVAHGAGVRYFVDAMSSFGAVPLDVPGAHIDYLVSSANKCIEGVPGFGFVIARIAALEETRGWARSLSFDLNAQWQGLEGSGQFRFTPPTHALLAFHQALCELEHEGGPAGRAARYRQNHEILVAGMRALGFREYLAPGLQGYIITSFLYPESPGWSFGTFYEKLNARGYVIYPGKVSNADCFRIGNIGRVFPADLRDLLAAIRDVLLDMGVPLPAD